MKFQIGSVLTEQETTESAIPPYNPQAIEKKWQDHWAATKVYCTPENLDDSRPTFYCLDFFPYPSGAGLSVGHGRNYVPTDVISRYYRMQGHDVLHPMGWDAFGLPAENEAIRRGVHPQQSTSQYAANYRYQLDRLGCSYDWDREINSSQTGFYQWTQWFFLLLYERGLAYQAVGRQWWCPDCKTVLANEQVEAGSVCWRCGQMVYKRDLEQWYFRITDYAESLLAGLSDLDWPEHILAMQHHWIGRSEGVEIKFKVENDEHPILVYTTRPETISGVSFLALAPEHPVVKSMTHHQAVQAYCQAAVQRSDVDRLQGTHERTGVFTGIYALNPVNQARVPIYVADYVLLSYGSGAIMAVPAHDERDFDFATRYNLPKPIVIRPKKISQANMSDHPYLGEGTMVQAGLWQGLPSQIVREKITDWLVEQGYGQRKINYRLRDWLISRQRYWGTPIPIIHCASCGTVPVPKADLPVELPEIDSWQPSADGRSPLANVPDFVHTTCPQCGGPAKRETDTIDGFACSSWYFLRFVSPHHAQAPFDPQALTHWQRPDLYVGGAEHAVMHLLYARFWTQVMADVGLIPFREPFPRLCSQGVMHAREVDTGEVRRMSKSAGNIVRPEDVADKHGADALRIYLCFMAPFEHNTTWEEGRINGSQRFLQRVWRLSHRIMAGSAKNITSLKPSDEAALNATLHHTIKRVTQDIEALKFNTAIAALMECLNALSEAYQQASEHQRHSSSPILRDAVKTFILLLAPFAPHISESLWQVLGEGERMKEQTSVHQQAWPIWDEKALATETVTFAVQVDGRVRDKVTVSATAAETDIRQAALACSGVQPYLQDRDVKRVIYVPQKIVNIVTGSE